MTQLNYFKLTPSTRETVSEDSKIEHDEVRGNIGSLIKPTLFQGGVWQVPHEVERSIMALYNGLSAERLSGKPCIETIDEDVRFLAEHVQLYLQNMEPPKEDLVLLHVRLEPSNGNGGQVDQVMRGLGYAMFELNEGYRDTI